MSARAEARGRDQAIVYGAALWDGPRNRRLHRSVALGNLTTNLEGNVALNFNLIANAEAWPRLGLSPSFTCLRARQLVGRRFLRCRSAFMLSALLVATLATLLRMSSRDDEVTLAGRWRPDNGHRRRLRCAENGTAAESGAASHVAVEEL